MIFIILILSPLLFYISNLKIERNAKNKIFFDLSLIGKNKVGLVLGTSKALRNGKPNPYFQYRIDATVELFMSHKIDFILVSGTNKDKDPNQPTAFKIELLKRNIPENKIFTDYHGYKILDSVVRAKIVYGLDTVTIISQKLYNERAIFIAKRHGMVAIGYNAKDLSRKNVLKSRFREYFERIKVFIDIIIRTKPKFLNDRVEIK